jgi:GNAT superfamily N-acetyltransferase
MGARIVTIAARPDIYERLDEIADPWPEFVHHDQVVNRLWPRLYEAFPEFQLALVDEDTLLGKANSIPVRWTGGDRLPGGVDDSLERGLARGEEPDVACALVAVIDERYRGQGLSSLLLEGMRHAARGAGLTAVVAPVRPTWKERYPLTPLERYMCWQRLDGSPFDPWIRVHDRLGALILGVAPQSLDIRGTIAEWEDWTEMAFPETGDYIVPGALVPVAIDRDRDEGRYVEPNVWMRHPVS